MRPVELERERAGGDPGKEQRNADPYDDGRGAEYERLEKDPERTEQQQDAAENSPARPGDLHGAHVVIKCETLSESLLRSAALLAAWYSKGRYSSSVPINYTKIRTLKRIKGAKNGLVALSSYQTIYIDPSKEAIQALNDAYLKQTH